MLSTGHTGPSWSGEGLSSQSCSVRTLGELIGAVQDLEGSFQLLFLAYAKNMTALRWVTNVR